MSFDSENLEIMKREIESILHSDKKFGQHHQLQVEEDDLLVLSWDDKLRPKAKASPGPYLEFMESLSDCLADYGYCLVADEGASETERNNYLLIVPEDEADFEE